MIAVQQDIPVVVRAEIGRSLRQWRRVRRVKQDHVAELMGVTQATVSKWEGGALQPDERQHRALRVLMAARPDGAADRELCRLVGRSPAAMHLVCDLTHRLLALSPRRALQCELPPAELMGRSLWPFASAEIAALEARLPDLGWFEELPGSIEAATGANDGRGIAIVESRFRSTRFRLSDGSFARLVETLDPA